MSEFVLVVAQQATFLYQLNGGNAVRLADMPVGEDAAFWLTQQIPERSDCSLVTDTIDESYLQSTLPALWVSGTRLQLLERRLLQQLRDTRYRAAVLIPSGSFKPPTRAIFVGIGQSERIKEYVDLLTIRHVRLKGLWPLSALIAVLANKKTFKHKDLAEDKSKIPAILLPTLTLVATPTGLRQVLSIGKTPLFSRLTISSSETGLSAHNVINEARRTVQYLIAQQWLADIDQPIATRLWLPVDDEETLVSEAGDIVLVVQALTRIADAYLLLLPELKNASPGLQLLPAANRLEWRAAQISRAAMAFGIASLAVSGLWSAELVWDSWTKNKLKSQQLAQAAAINQQARQEVLQAKGDLSQASLAVVTVQAWQKAVQSQPDQAEAMRHLVNALKSISGLTLEKMRWELPGVEPEAPGAPPPVFGCPKLAGVATLAAGATAAAAKSATAMLNLTAVLDDDISQREALLLQGKIVAQLSTNGWAANMTKSTIEFDPAQRQTGIVGKSGARSVELCMERVPR